MRNFRMRMRVLNFSSCPDWRKVRVGNKVADEEEIPEEWEMEQTALDKLAIKRQTSLVKLNDECLELQKQLEEEDITVLKPTTLEFIAASKSLDNGMWPSPVNRQPSGLPSQSQSLQNLTQYPKSILHLSVNDKVHAQRLKKLKELRNELEEYEAVHKNKDIQESASASYENGSLAFFHRGSNLNLVNLHQMEHANAKYISEINHKIQKRREKELQRARREIQVLEHKIQQKHL